MNIAKQIKPLCVCLISGLILTACSWNTYTKEDGSTGLRPTNKFGQSVYYEDGTYARDQRYNEHRPIRRVLGDEEASPSNARVHWQ